MTETEKREKRKIERLPLVESIVAVIFDKKINTWHVMHASAFDFSRARSSCNECWGRGKHGQTEAVLDRKDGTRFRAKVPVVCPRCHRFVVKTKEEIQREELEKAAQENPPEKMAPNSPSDGRSPGPEGNDQGDSKAKEGWLKWALILAWALVAFGVAAYFWR